MPTKKRFTKRRFRGGIGSPKRVVITKKNMTLFPYTASIMKDKEAARRNAITNKMRVRGQADRAVWNRWTELAEPKLENQINDGKGPQRVVSASALQKYINANCDDKIDLHDTKQIMKQITKNLTY